MDYFKYLSGVLFVCWIMALIVWKQEYDMRTQYQEITDAQTDSIWVLTDALGQAYQELKKVEKDTVKTDTLEIEKLCWNYSNASISWIEQIKDIDATWLLPQRQECLEAYKWLREKRKYSAKKSIELIVKWWEKEGNL